eukprot:1420828-Rhodomonas_salina.2
MRMRTCEYKGVAGYAYASPRIRVHSYGDTHTAVLEYACVSTGIRVCKYGDTRMLTCSSSFRVGSTW